MARTGLAAEPPEQPPEGLRRVLGFRKLQTAALDTVRRVLESDEAFRALVSKAGTEEELGRLAWVWLTRPEGWEEELAMLADEARRNDDSTDERDIGQLRRALQGAEEATRRHQDAASRATEGARRAQAELTEARAARRDADRTAQEWRAAAAGAAGERDEAQEQLVAVSREVEQARAELEVARSALHEAESELVLERVGRTGEGPPTTSAADTQGQVEIHRLGEQLEAAAATAAALSKTLAEAAEGLGQDSTSRPASASQPSTSPNPPTHRKQSRRQSAPGRSGARLRRPADLPPGVWDDDPAAAAHLVRLPDAVVLVDGYNVARTAWPGLMPEEERQRLIAALEELQARTAVEIIVVFDGVKEGAAMPGLGSRTVRVRFTAEGTPADDVVRDLVDLFPAHRPVIVVSSDREVADGARARGANAVSSRQFLTALGR